MTLCKTEKFSDGLPAGKNVTPYPCQTALHTIKESRMNADMLFLPEKGSGNSIIQTWILENVTKLHRHVFENPGDKLDVIECFEDANHSLRIGELLNKHAKIYEDLGVKVPTSSC